MRILAFDGRMGAAGDMLLGALVAAGADPAVLAPVEDDLPVTYSFESVVKNGIASTDARVVHDEADGHPSSDEGAAARDHDTHSHDAHDHDHGSGDRSHDHGPHGHDGEAHHHDGEAHGHDHDSHHRDGGDRGSGADCPRGHDHAHHHGAEGHGPGRTYAEVVELVEGMALPESVREEALATFELLGEAESSVHDQPLADTAFHEVGTDDAVADVVGCCLLLADLAPERVVTTPLSTGEGEVAFSHGVYPVPVPAVVELAQRADWSLRGGPVEAELLTPTGAAILARIAEGVDRLPSLRVESSGYGAGGHEFPDRPNVLRALVGDATEADTDDAEVADADEASGTAADATGDRGGFVREAVTVLETNLDDATPETLGGLHGSLRAAGALDVTVLPATMKKSRPGHLVTVVCSPDDAEAVAHRLAVETGTLGVRERDTHRWVAERTVETVGIDVGGTTYDVPVKVASDAGGDVYDVSAEYDDAAAVGREAGVPAREVMRRAEAAARGGRD